MNSYPRGSTVRLKAVFTDENNVPVDPTTVAFLIVPPIESGIAEIEKDYPDFSITHQGTGIYTYDLDLEEYGTWRYGARSTGVGKAALEGALVVPSSVVL